MATRQGLDVDSAFLRLQKIKKGPTSALTASRHNLRELPLTPNISPGLQSHNQVLDGPATAIEVQRSYREALLAAGITRLRRDAVRLLEAIVSLPVGSEGELGAYFEAALTWFRTEFGAANIISAVVHRDEAAPHMHVLIVPLVDGHMQGSDMFGGPSDLRARHRRFRQAMQGHWNALGIENAPRHSIPVDEQASAVLAALKRKADAAWSSAVWPQIRDAIKANPAAFYAALGLHPGHPDCESPAPGVESTDCSPNHPRKRRVRARTRMRTMAEIFTKPQRKRAKVNSLQRSPKTCDLAKRHTSNKTSTLLSGRVSRGGSPGSQQLAQFPCSDSAPAGTNQQVIRSGDVGAQSSAALRGQHRNLCSVRVPAAPRAPVSLMTGCVMAAAWRGPIYALTNFATLAVSPCHWWPLWPRAP